MSLYHRPGKSTDDGQDKTQELIPEYDEFRDCIQKELATMSLIFKILLVLGLIIGLFFYLACQMAIKIGNVCTTHPFELFVIMFLTGSVLFILCFAAFMKY